MEETDPDVLARELDDEPREADVETLERTLPDSAPEGVEGKEALDVAEERSDEDVSTVPLSVALPPGVWDIVADDAPLLERVSDVDTVTDALAKGVADSDATDVEVAPALSDSGDGDGIAVLATDSDEEAVRESDVVADGLSEGESVSDSDDCAEGVRAALGDVD